ncbi:MAG: ethanolamine utilization protein EutH, partial [Defluviitaleaceae bacterium]|nr:ethanolamine utilization protein EutH [Defluviitaleaceae bacterium]
MFNDLIESLTNLKIFEGSLKDFLQEISVSSVIMSIIVIFMLIGLIDKLRGNKHGYGERFDAGFQAMGDLALAVIGIIAVSPVLLLLLTPVVSPLYTLIGASPAMFPGSLLALDMGGYAMATQMAGDNAAVGNYAGIIVASMMGITLCFTIPYAPTVLKKDDHPIFAMGVLIGIVTLPVGCLVGGLAMAFTSTPMPFAELLINTLPVIALSVIICAGLLWKQKTMLKIFSAFGKGVSIVATTSLGIAVFQYLTGIRLPLFYLMVEENEALGMVPLEFAIWLVGAIAIVLAGAFPMILFLNRRLGKLMDKFGSKAGVGKEASTGLLTQLASSIPVWSVVSDMDKRGKLLNVVFAVSGSFVLGDVLAFTGGVNPEMVFPVIAAKLTGG